MNSCKKANETFGSLISNSIGDPMIEPAKYHLIGNSTAENPFINMHSNRTVAKSEFVLMHTGRSKPLSSKKAKGLQK
jgi:seryl-tRNA synthetase